MKENLGKELDKIKKKLIWDEMIERAKEKRIRKNKIRIRNARSNEEGKNKQI